MNHSIKLTAVALIALTLGAGCADFDSEEATESSDVTSDSIVGGTIDKAHPSVVSIRFNKGEGSASCTGTLIAKTIVLTAAHCVASGSSKHRVYFGYDAKMAKESDWIPTSKAVAHKDYKGSGKGHDAAILVLSKEAPSSVTPTPINRKALEKGLVGKNLLAVGFGVTDGNGKGEKSGTKRKVEIPVLSILEEEVKAGSDQKSVCNGDSGGPWFQVVNGKETVVGITSYGKQDCRSGGYATRVDKVLDLIDPYLKGTGGGGGTGGGNKPKPTPPKLPGFESEEDGEEGDDAAANADE